MWQVVISSKAQKHIDKLPKADTKHIVAAIEEMEIRPLSGDLAKLEENSYRRRVGNYRIFFEVMEREEIVHVTAVKRRTSTTYR